MMIPLVSFFPHPSPLQYVQFVKLYNIENCYTILGNYSLVFVTKLQRISHFKFEFFLSSSNFLVPPFYPPPKKKQDPIIRIILVPPLSSVNLSRGVVRENRGRVGLEPPPNPSPLSPQMKWHFGVYGEPPVWVRSAPVPAPLAPPHFEKASYAPANNTAQNIIEFDLLYSWSIYFTSPVKH